MGVLLKYKKQVEFAYKNIPLYISLSQKQRIDIDELIKNDDWEAIPLIDKDLYVESKIPYIPFNRVMDLDNEKLIHDRTSGSTGKYLDIYWDKADYNYSMLPLWFYRYKYYGIMPNDKLCYFYTARDVGEIENKYYESKTECGFSKYNLNDDWLFQIYNKMQSFQPKWLILQPSVAAIFMDFLNKNQLEKIESIQYVELTGEVLTKSIKERVKNTFECNVANQYGANEVNSIAYECPYGNLHIMNTNVYVESIRDCYSGLDCLYITSLRNSVMPLIRYKIGDFGKIVRNSKCECGNKNHILLLDNARTSDTINTDDGSVVSARIFVSIFDKINLILDLVVKQFIVKQIEINRFIVYLVLDDITFIDIIKDMFEKYILNTVLRNALFEFEIKERLMPDEFCGKLSYFVK